MVAFLRALLLLAAAFAPVLCADGPLVQSLNIFNGWPRMPIAHHKARAPVSRTFFHLLSLFFPLKAWAGLMNNCTTGDNMALQMLLTGGQTRIPCTDVASFTGCLAELYPPAKSALQVHHHHPTIIEASKKERKRKKEKKMARRMLALLPSYFISFYYSSSFFHVVTKNKTWNYKQTGE